MVEELKKWIIETHKGDVLSNEYDHLYRVDENGLWWFHAELEEYHRMIVLGNKVFAVGRKHVEIWDIDDKS